ncbi:MAG: hypothetical protein R3F18_11095 [Lysobacterales bacterium]|nr:hypothetical protein [Xanthomonadales bacterium]MCB1613425.1 hypothetical protein [Xanthomonadales bacterium]MCP5474787.1 phosphopantetheine adenylyltransferase [Rhodanobacteraceae bacterium]
MQAEKPAREWLIQGALLLAGLIHLLPAASFFQAGLLTELYALSPGSNLDLILLMRHRGAMFGLLAMALLAAIWHRPWRGLCIAWTALSDLAFLLLMISAWPPSASLLRIFQADVLSLALLLSAAMAMRSARSARA